MHIHHSYYRGQIPNINGVHWRKNHFFLHGCRAGTPVGGGLVITSLLQVTNFTSLDIHFSPPSSSSLSYSIIQFAQKINLSENQYTLFHLNPIKLLLGSLSWKRLTSRFDESLSWGRAQEPSCQEITGSSLEYWLVIGSSAFFSIQYGAIEITWFPSAPTQFKQLHQIYVYNQSNQRLGFYCLFEWVSHAII